MLRPSLLFLVPALMAAAERWQVEAPAGVSQVRLWPSEDHRSASAGGVPLRVVSAGPGEPLVLLLAPSAAGKVVITTDARPATDAPWTARGGLLVEARGPTEGPLDTTEEVRTRWDRARLQGRTVVERLFLGANPCGPSTSCLLRIEGWLRVPTAGTWHLATISQDASVVTVDGAPAVAWLGYHGADQGTRGQHARDLTLSAGDHHVVYLVAAVRRSVVAELAWQGPGVPTWEVIPTRAWAPAPEVVATPVGNAPWLTWTMAGHQDFTGGALVEVEATAYGLPGPIHWSWDDGGEALGPTVTHLFLRPGLHTVTVTAGGTTLRRTIAVHPAWDWTGSWTGADLKRRQMDLATREPARMPPEDLAPALALTRDEDEPALATWQQGLLTIGAKHLATRADLRDQFLGLTEDLATAEDGDPARAAALAQAVAATASAGDPQASRAGLRLASLLIRDLDRPAAGATALEGLREAVLTADERRQRAILRGDAAAGRGDLDAARAAWTEAGSLTSPADRAAAVRRRVRLERARDLLAMPRRAEAADLLASVLGDRPAERLEADVAVLLAHLALARHQPRAALAALRPAIKAAPLDDRRAEALGLFIDAATALGLGPEADAAKSTLRHDHPWSDAAGRFRP